MSLEPQQSSGHVPDLDEELVRREALFKESIASQEPLRRDLASVGEMVGTVYDLVDTSRPYPAALPVLIDHLQRGGYPPRVMEGIGRALAVKPAIQWWDILVDRYLNALDVGEREGAGVALAACATKKQFEELCRLASLPLDDPRKTRAMFLRALVRIDRDRGWDVVRSLVDDPVSGVQARHMLKERLRREKRNQDV